MLRIVVPGGPLLLFVSVALAGDVGSVGPVSGPDGLRVEERVVPWAEFGFVPAAQEQKAIGPDRVAAGADGLAAVWDPVRQQVLVLHDLVVQGAFAASRVDDLAFAGRDLVLLEGRTIALVGADGRDHGNLPVPDLVPTNIDLLVQGSDVWGVDPFGNRHAIAHVEGGLSVATGASFGGPAFAKVEVTPRAGALKTSVRTLGAGWAIVDSVVSDFPIGVERAVVHDGRSLPLETRSRSWTPADDADVDAEGRLVVIVPLADGLHVRRISQ